MRKWLRILMRDERGVTTLEYALVLALIVASGVVVWQSFGETINDSGMSSTESIGCARDSAHAMHTPPGGVPPPPKP